MPPSLSQVDLISELDWAPEILTFPAEAALAMSENVASATMKTKSLRMELSLLCKPTAVLSPYLNDISFASYASVTCPTLGYSKLPIVFPTQAHMKTARLWRARVQNH